MCQLILRTIAGLFFNTNYKDVKINFTYDKFKIKDDNNKDLINIEVIIKNFFNNDVREFNFSSDNIDNSKISQFYLEIK